MGTECGPASPWGTTSVPPALVQAPDSRLSSPFGAPKTPTSFLTPPGSIPLWPPAPRPQVPSLPCTTPLPVAPDPCSQPRGGPTTDDPTVQAPENVHAGLVASPESRGPDPKDPRPCLAIPPVKGMWPTIRQASSFLSPTPNLTEPCLQCWEDGGQAPETPPTPPSLPATGPGSSNGSRLHKGTGGDFPGGPEVMTPSPKAGLRPCWGD